LYSTKDDDGNGDRFVGDDDGDDDDMAYELIRL